MIQLTTIKQQIHDLNPQEANRMEMSGEMAEALEDYREQLIAASVEAARVAKLENKGEHPEVRIQAQEMAARAAKEVAMSQIMEELQAIYGPQETTE
jgi:hypothetical protein